MATFSLFRFFLWLSILILSNHPAVILAQRIYTTQYYISSLAGGGAPFGSVDGSGTGSRFNMPTGASVDSVGNLYIADRSNHKIRKITPAGVVSTLAGSGTQGYADGIGTAASFQAPEGVAVDSNGNVYVADTNNFMIRKITPAGVVSTLAGVRSRGTTDGNSTDARFFAPNALAVDNNGNIYVTDIGRIRKITATGVVSTLAGGSGISGSLDGSIATATFEQLKGIAVDAGGNLYVAQIGNQRKIRKITTTGVVSTLAGSGDWGSADGIGSVASFKEPYGLAVDGVGNVYVADKTDQKIRKITSAGLVSTLAGLGDIGLRNGSGPNALFSYPTGVTVNSNGTVYVAEIGNHTIRKITMGGLVSTMAGSGIFGSVDGIGATTSFYNPNGVSVDLNSNIYVADTGSNKIRKITSSGVVSTIAGSNEEGSVDGDGANASFSSPTGVALDGSGNIYVADYGSRKIRKITTTGVVSTLAGSGNWGNTDGIGSAASFKAPYGVAVDGSGNVYVSDLMDHKVRKITPEGIVSTFAGSGSAGHAEGTGAASSFYSPTGVAVDSSGNVYVADSNNYRVRKVTSAGIVSTLAGSGSYGSADGIGAVASFTNLGGVAVDRDGNIYVADGISIRQITSAGTVSTVAGGLIYDNTDGRGAAAGFKVARGIAVDVNTNIYITDQNSHKVRFGQPPTTQTITFLPLAEKSYGDAPFTVSAIADSGLPVAFSIVSGPATILGTTITLTGAGTVVVRASQAGSPAWASALNVDQAFTVAKNSQTITFEAMATKTFGDAPFGISATATSSLPVSFSILSGPVTLSGSTVTMNGTGTVIVRASQPGNVNYQAAPPVDRSFLIKSGQIITLSSLPAKTFGDAPFLVNANSSSGLPVTISILSGPAAISGNTITLTGPGTVVVRVSQAGNATYAVVNRDESFIVAKVPQGITFTTLAGKSYEDVPFTVSGSASSGLPVAFSIVSGPATLSGNTISLTSAGTVVVRASQAGDATYAPAVSVDQSFTVAKSSQSLTFQNITNRLLGTSNVTLSATSSSGLATTFSVVSGSATISGSSLTFTAAGIITVKATQAGNTSYLPAPDVTVSFTVLPNTSAPSSIAISKNWFYDNVALNTQIGTLSATDLDVGDIISYTLVTGTGSTDNAKFIVSGNILRTASTAFNYNTQRTASIRIRVTDLAGQFIEQVMTLLLIDGTPSALIIKKQVLPERPAFVNVMFQLLDSQGFGINYPRGFLDANPGLFQIEEQNSNGIFVPIGSESFAQVQKFNEIPSETKTVILIDASDSALDPILQNAVKAGVRALIERKIPNKQKIAIYAFAETLTLLQDFSDDATLLNDALNRIPITGGSTDLYGAIISTLPRWNERFELTGIETGSMIVFTDGAHTFDAKTPESVVNAAAATSSSPAKQIYAVGLRSPDLDVNALTQISTPSRYFEATDTTQLVSKFELVQSRIEDQANSIYWMNYYTSKRAGTAQVRIKLSGNSPATNWLDVSFNAVGFSTPARKIIVNRRVDKVDGEIDFEFATNGFAVADLLSFRGIPPSALTAVVDDPELVDVVRISATRFELRGKGLNGTTTLTVSDSAASLVPARRLPVRVGTGIALPPQIITFAALADRATTSPAFTITASASSLLPVSFTLISGPATLTGNTVTLTGAAGTVTIRANQVGNASFAAANSETRSFTVASSGVLLTNWASSSGLSGPNTAPTATPFNDGVENLLKYAFNMNAAGPDVRVLTTGGSSGLPQIAVDSSGAEPVLKVAFLRRKGSGLIYTPQRSDTLGNFQSMTGTQTVTSINAQWERVTVEEPAPPANTSSAFARVQVSLP